MWYQLRRAGALISVSFARRVEITRQLSVRPPGWFSGGSGWSGLRFLPELRSV
jgi:hypothetical protein